FAASVVARLSGGRVFYWNCGEPWKYNRGFLRDFFERMVYRLVTFHVTGAPSLGDQYAAHYRIPRSKIKILPNWIDLRRFVPQERPAARRKLGIADDRKVILFVHRLSPRKGSRMILPVAREVLRACPPALFMVVGSGPDEGFLKEEISKDNVLGQGIRMEGKVPNAKIPMYFSAADVFFMPSEEEGFPRVLLESMAFGVPFVASNVGVVKEIVPELMHVSVVASGDVAAMAEKLCGWLETSREDRKKFASALIEWVKRYDVPFITRAFRNLFI
ncbi:MAG: glycosyltransferase family 4 protein, partial [bacterium]|nr:glycosyltransferase family 4 protein [bacterium]